MAGKYVPAKWSTTLLAGAAVLTMGLGSTLSSALSGAAPRAHATPAPKNTTVTKTAQLTCRTNGAPLGYNLTQSSAAIITMSGPKTVRPGSTTIVHMQYFPETSPGKKSIASLQKVENIAIRFTLNDPQSFVTARAVSKGKSLTRQPRISLVKEKTLVLSGMAVNVGGKDTPWTPPALELTFTAPRNGNPLRTLHMAVEGDAGKFNNPANTVAMSTLTSTPFGSFTIWINCQALSGTTSLFTIPVK